MSILKTLILFSILALALQSQAGEERSPETLLLKDYRPRSIYNVPVTKITRGRFPVVDTHTQDYAKTNLGSSRRQEAQFGRD